MTSLVNKLRRMSYTGTDQHDDTIQSAGFAVTAKNLTITNQGSRVKSSKKKIEWHVGLCSKDVIVTLIDSITSGRKQIFVNGAKVHDVKTKTKQTTWSHRIRDGNFDLEIKIGDNDGENENEPRYNLLINTTPYRQLRRGSVFVEGSAPPPPPPNSSAAFSDSKSTDDTSRSRAATGGSGGSRGSSSSSRKKSKKSEKSPSGRSKRSNSNSSSRSKSSPSNASDVSRRDSVESFDPFAETTPQASDAFDDSGFDDGFGDFD